MPRSPNHVRLWCGNGHDHLLTPEAGDRLEGTPCCWCGEPILIAGGRMAREQAQAQEQAQEVPEKLVPKVTLYCDTCSEYSVPKLSMSGPSLKASCGVCGQYIKFVPKARTEWAALAHIQRVEVPVDNIVRR